MGACRCPTCARRSGRSPRRAGGARDPPVLMQNRPLTALHEGTGSGASRLRPYVTDAANGTRVKTQPLEFFAVDCEHPPRPPAHCAKTGHDDLEEKRRDRGRRRRPPARIHRARPRRRPSATRFSDAPAGCQGPWSDRSLSNPSPPQSVSSEHRSPGRQTLSLCTAACVDAARVS